MRGTRAAAAVLSCMCLSLLTACAGLPPLAGRSSSSGLPAAEAAATALGQAVQPHIEAHPGLTGLLTLGDARDAFAKRMLLSRAAERTLDVQYYIWRNDMTGTLLLEALHVAADRGVRVRLLLDDNGTADLDTELMALDMHPNIEVRLFNPFRVRSPKWIGFVTDFSRVNRRMHNKSFTADNQVTIIGGRNVGDEYFGAANGLLFADLDVLAVGPVVQEMTADFDRYWASASSYPVSLILPPVSAERLDALATQATLVEVDPDAATFMDAMNQTPLIERLEHGGLTLYWAPTRMVSDDPAKGLAAQPRETLVLHEIGDIVGSSSDCIDLVSPYFVPAVKGTEALRKYAAAGVKVRVLTNALEATDVTPVHGGYARRRKDLLRGGVVLYEMRRPASALDVVEHAGPFGSSGSSLHAKTFSVDRSRVFIGSFNFDPRSAHLNTELGFIIESASLAARIDDAFMEIVPQNAYSVHLDENDRLYWIEERDGERIRHDVEPNTGFLKRIAVWVLSKLPIEWML